MSTLAQEFRFVVLDLARSSCLEEHVSFVDIPRSFPQVLFLRNFNPVGNVTCLLQKQTPSMLQVCGARTNRIIIWGPKELTRGKDREQTGARETQSYSYGCLHN